MGDRFFDRLRDAAANNNLVLASQTDTFQVLLGVLVVAIGLATLDYAGRRRAVLAAGGGDNSLSVFQHASAMFRRFPVHVAGGSIAALRGFQRLLVFVNVFIGALAVTLPFTLERTAQEIAKVQGFLFPPRVMDGIAAFEREVLLVLIGYAVFGVLLRFSRSLYVAHGSGERDSRLQLAIAGMAAFAAVVLFFALMAKQWMMFQTFFDPEGDANFGFLLAYNATTGTMEQNLLGQLLLAPIYSFAASAFIAPVAFAGSVAVFATARGSDKAASERRKRSRGRLASFLGPVAPGMVVSALLTVWSVSLSDISGGSQDIFPTPAFLFLNAVCDALTIAVTLSVIRRIFNMSRASRFDGSIRSGLGLVVRGTPWVILDLAVSAMLAVAVLVYGGAEAGMEFTWREAAFVLFGLSPDGSRLALNASFWAMHTTFIPTLIFLSALAVALFTIPIMAFRNLYARWFGDADRLLMAVDIVAFVFGGSIAINLGLMWILNIFGDFNFALYQQAVYIIVDTLF